MWRGDKFGGFSCDSQHCCATNDDADLEVAVVGWGLARHGTNLAQPARRRRASHHAAHTTRNAAIARIISCCVIEQYLQNAVRVVSHLATMIVDFVAERCRALGTAQTLRVILDTQRLDLLLRLHHVRVAVRALLWQMRLTVRQFAIRVKLGI